MFTISDMLATESESSDEDIVINDETSVEELQLELSFAGERNFLIPGPQQQHPQTPIWGVQAQKGRNLFCKLT